MSDEHFTEAVHIYTETKIHKFKQKPDRFDRITKGYFVVLFKLLILSRRCGSIV